MKSYPQVGIYLSEIHDILYPSNLHFGYRVVNEIATFIRHAFEMVEEMTLENGIDIQILQKILPKFHGTQAKLEEPLGKLLAFCRGENNPIEESYLQVAAYFDKEARFPPVCPKVSPDDSEFEDPGLYQFY